MDDESTENSAPAGLPAWVMTFADLMSLLMCFFVLLLSFAEMDIEKYKQISGSMKNAFGVQRQIKADESPKGTSIIAREFSPGKPTPTPFQIIRQVTTNEMKQNLDFTDSTAKNQEKTPDTTDSESPESPPEEAQAAAEIEAQDVAKLLENLLKDAVEKGQIEIDSKDNIVVIRVREKGTFKSGRAHLQTSFVPVLDKISRVVGKLSGPVVVAGHTDNIPISTKTFPSNWELSAARAATFVHFIKRRGRVKAKRLEIRAHGEVIPISDNNTPAGRARNRRVEIMIEVKEGDMQILDASGLSRLMRG